jgi:hypothetical protein
MKSAQPILEDDARKEILDAAVVWWEALEPRPAMSATRFRELVEAIDKAMDLRSMQEAAAAHHGQQVERLIMCIGPGRCMFASDLASKQICPFCLTVDDRLWNHPIALARRVAQGH